MIHLSEAIAYRDSCVASQFVDIIYKNKHSVLGSHGVAQDQGVVLKRSAWCGIFTRGVQESQDGHR